MPTNIIRSAVLSASLFCATAIAVPAAASNPPSAAAADTEPQDPIALLAMKALGLLGDEGIGGHASHEPAGAYAAARDAAAGAVAERLGLDAIAMRLAWGAADAEHQRAVLGGLTQLGVPYRRNSSEEGVGFDCSGLTAYAWGWSGLSLARQSGSQIKDAEPRTLETAQVGDLMQYPGHVMMWLGVGRGVLQSPYPGRSVEVVLYRAGRTVRVADPTE